MTFFFKENINDVVVFPSIGLTKNGFVIIVPGIGIKINRRPRRRPMVPTR